MSLTQGLGVGDVVVTTRPQGYIITDGTLRTYRELQASSSGLDYQRRAGFETVDYVNPENIFLVTSRDIAAGASITYSFTANLLSPVDHPPRQQQPWRVRTFRVLPQFDTDGEVLDTRQVPYPWTNRGLEMTGTND